MTVATFYENGNKFFISILGHANYGNGGPDIVCASCSTLSYTLLQCAHELKEKRSLFKLQHEETEGGLTIDMVADYWSLAKVKTILGVIVAGFALLEDRYPDHVRLVVNDGEK